MLKLYLTNFFNFLVIMYIATIVIYFYLINIYFGVNCLLINMFKFIFFNYTLNLYYNFITNIDFFNNSHLIEPIKILNSYEENDIK